MIQRIKNMLGKRDSKSVNNSDLNLIGDSNGNLGNPTMFSSQEKSAAMSKAETATSPHVPLAMASEIPATPIPGSVTTPKGPSAGTGQTASSQASDFSVSPGKGSDPVQELLRRYDKYVEQVGWVVSSAKKSGKIKGADENRADQVLQMAEDTLETVRSYQGEKGEALTAQDLGALNGRVDDLNSAYSALAENAPLENLQDFWDGDGQAGMISISEQREFASQSLSVSSGRREENERAEAIKGGALSLPGVSKDGAPLAMQSSSIPEKGQPGSDTVFGGPNPVQELLRRYDKYVEQLGSVVSTAKEQGKISTADAARADQVIKAAEDVLGTVRSYQGPRGEELTAESLGSLNARVDDLNHMYGALAENTQLLDLQPFWEGNEDEGVPGIPEQRQLALESLSVSVHEDDPASQPGGFPPIAAGPDPAVKVPVAGPEPGGLSPEGTSVSSGGIQAPPRPEGSVGGSLGNNASGAVNSNPVPARPGGSFVSSNSVNGTEMSAPISAHNLSPTPSSRGYQAMAAARQQEINDKLTAAFEYDQDAMREAEEKEKQRTYADLTERNNNWNGNPSSDFDSIAAQQGEIEDKKRMRAGRNPVGSSDSSSSVPYGVPLTQEDIDNFAELYPNSVLPSVGSVLVEQEYDMYGMPVSSEISDPNNSGPFMSGNEGGVGPINNPGRYDPLSSANPGSIQNNIATVNDSATLANMAGLATNKEKQMNHNLAPVGGGTFDDQQRMRANQAAAQAAAENTADFLNSGTGSTMAAMAAARQKNINDKLTAAFEYDQDAMAAADRRIESQQQIAADADEQAWLQQNSRELAADKAAEARARGILAARQQETNSTDTQIGISQTQQPAASHGTDAGSVAHPTGDGPGQLGASMLERQIEQQLEWNEGYRTMIARGEADTVVNLLGGALDLEGYNVQLNADGTVQVTVAPPEPLLGAAGESRPMGFISTGATGDGKDKKIYTKDEIRDREQAEEFEHERREGRSVGGADTDSYQEWVENFTATHKRPPNSKERSEFMNNRTRLEHTILTMAANMSNAASAGAGGGVTVGPNASVGVGAAASQQRLTQEGKFRPDTMKGNLATMGGRANIMPTGSSVGGGTATTPNMHANTYSAATSPLRTPNPASSLHQKTQVPKATKQTVAATPAPATTTARNTSQLGISPSLTAIERSIGSPKAMVTATKSVSQPQAIKGSANSLKSGQVTTPSNSQLQAGLEKRIGSTNPTKAEIMGGGIKQSVPASGAKLSATQPAPASVVKVIEAAPKSNTALAMKSVAAVQPITTASKTTASTIKAAVPVTKPVSQPAPAAAAKPVVAAPKTTASVVKTPAPVPAAKPAAQPAPASAAAPKSTTVQSGDGWYALAARSGVSVDALLRANNATLSTTIHPGQKLNVPTASPVGSSASATINSNPSGVKTTATPMAASKTASTIKSSAPSTAARVTNSYTPATKSASKTVSAIPGASTTKTKTSNSLAQKAF